jgi:hypothetical protein
LIYRIDSSLDGDGNAEGPPDEVFLYRPNGTPGANGQINQANYSSLVGRTAINDGTVPSGFLQDGSAGGLNISNISSPDTTMSFYVDFSTPPTTFDEGFESGDFSHYTWQLQGNANWSVVAANAYNGLYSAKSGTIGNSQSSTIEILYEAPDNGSIGFYKKVSSQSGHDYLVFYIDSVEQLRWSGTLDWSYSSFPVTAGMHVFSWTYMKNASTSSGSDCAWLDNITFPHEAPPPMLPPSNLSVQLENGNHAYLHWLAPLNSEPIGFVIYKNGEFLDMVSFGDSTVYYDYSLLTGPTLYYMTSMYENGESPSSNQVTISPVVANDDQVGAVPLTTGLTSIYPNPFNPETNITYQVKDQGSVSIDIYNIRGEKTKHLFQGVKSAGKYSVSWLGKDDAGHTVASGVYFVRFTGAGHQNMRKIILLK